GDDDDDEDNDDDDEEEETAKNDEELKKTGTGGDDVREGEGESEEEEVSFDPIPRTSEDSEKESDDVEEQESRLSEAQIPPPTIPSIILKNLPTFNSAFRFEERLRLLETSFNEYRQTNQVAGAVSAIPGIVHQYMDQQMKEAVREAVQKQTDQLQDSLQRENDEFLRNIDENMKNVLKGTSYAVAADLSEMELKKILIEKME
nr:hypothetical protein [Tanacetum cinerariifolium]